MIIQVKDKATQVHMVAMVAAVVRPMARAIMIHRTEGMYTVLDSLAKGKEGRRRGRDNHSSSRAAHTKCHGGLIDCCEVATLGYECGTFVMISWRVHSGFSRHIKASGEPKSFDIRASSETFFFSCYPLQSYIPGISRAFWRRK